jgi:hypothetical protein
MKGVYIVIISFFLILLIFSIITTVLYYCPIEVEHIPYHDKKIISREHYNGTYLNNAIVARRKLFDFYNRHQHMQISNKNSNWKDFVLGKDKYYEDARIFKINDNLYPHIIMWVEFGDVRKYQDPKDGFTLCASLLNTTNNVIKVITLYDPEFPLDKQKNWVLLNANDLHDTHWTQWFGPKHKVMRVNMLTGEIKHGWTTHGVVNLRGGTPLFEYNNKLYGVCHVTRYFPRKICCRLIELDSKPPYKILRISKEFTFHKNPKYEFPCGIKFDGNMVYILLGLDDSELIEVKITIKDFIKHLKDPDSFPSILYA